MKQPGPRAGSRASGNAPRPRPPQKRARSPRRVAQKQSGKPRRPQTAQETRPQIAASFPQRIPALPVLASVILGAAILWAPFAPFVSPKPSRLWKGYQTVLVRVGGAADLALPSMVSRLGPGVISESTTTVDFYDFSSITRYPYAGLTRRLDSMDPRRDPYMDRMAGYFTVSAGDADYHVLYVPARSTSFSLFVELWRILGPPDRAAWRIADFDPLEKALSIIAPSAFAVLFALGAGRKRRGWTGLGIVASLTWLPSVLAGGPSVLAFCLLNLSFSLPLLRARLAAPGNGRSGLRWGPGLLRMYLVASVASTAFFVLLEGLSSSVFLILAPLACTIVLASLVPFFSRALDGWRKARVFAPVPLFKNGRDPAKGRQRALTLALFAIALVSLAPLLRDGAFPAPVPVWGARHFSWDAVARLWKAPKADRLPDFSDFVAHEAYQQTIGLGASWKEPLRDQRVYRQEYLVDPVSGVVRARLRTVKVFDSTWLASVTTNPAPESLEALLTAQGRPVAAAIRGPARALAGELPFTALAFAALVAILARDLGAGLLIRASLWRINGEARRDQIS
jgi:hypothetical protein